MIIYDIFKHWGNNIYCISDPHFGDFECYKLRGLIQALDKKSYLNKFKDGDIFETYSTYIKKLVKEADERQIRRINSICGKNDTLIILGDVGNIECVKQLKAGYKILVMGNHEKGASNYKREIHQETRIGFELEEVIINNDNKLFDEVYDGPLMINDRIILSHEPITPLSDYLFNAHGHVHDKNYKGDKNHLNVCAEAIDYRPFNLLSAIKKGLLKNIPNIHRPTIDNATERKKKRNKKRVDVK